MASLGSQATHRPRGDRNPHVGFDDPLENRGWAVWYRVRMGKARVSGTPAQGPADRGLQTVSGFEVEVNLTTVMGDTWPEFRHLDKASRDAFGSEVRTYLRASGNAVCLRSPGLGAGDHGQPLWWIREEWNDVKAVGIFRQTELTRRERQLTPEEVGEDREPAPVETRKSRSDAMKESQALQDVFAERREAFARQRADYLRQIREVLEAAEYPLYNTEVADLAGISHSIVEKILREEAAAGTVARRIETQEERIGHAGRAHYLHWPTSPVPERSPDLYRSTRSLLDKLEGGSTVLKDRLSSGQLEDAAALVETGLAIEFTGDDGRVRLRKATAAEFEFKAHPRRSNDDANLEEHTAAILEEGPPATETEEETVTEEKPAVKASLESVMLALGDLIEAQVRAATGELQQRLTEAEARLEAESRARAEAERRLDEQKAKLREVFGF